MNFIIISHEIGSFLMAEGPLANYQKRELNACQYSLVKLEVFFRDEQNPVFFN